MIPLIVLIHHLLQQQRPTLQRFVKVGDEEIGIVGGRQVFRSEGISFNGHVELLEQIVGDVMVGIVFEITFVRLV
jgi:hypothetical protein